jgi:hypothetical protein
MENLSDFSRTFKSLLKFIKDSNVESVTGFDVGTIEKIVHDIPR